MSVYDFINYCVEPGFLNVHIFSLDKGDIIYTGYADEIPNNIVNAEIWSFDAPSINDKGYITINID